MSRVALAIPCYVEVLRPAERGHARKVLEALGDEVIEIRGLCCGQPAFNSGRRREALAVGGRFLREVRRHERVVIPSGSCASMVSHYLPGLFDEARRPGAGRAAALVTEFAAYVAANPRAAEVPWRLEGTVAYHDSCHARRELGITGEVATLLDRVAGLEVRRLRFEAECCGFGGTFSAKQPEVSGAMRSAKLADVRETGANVLVSTDLSCLSQVATGAVLEGTPLETWTVAELLARALP